MELNIAALDMLPATEEAGLQQCRMTCGETCSDPWSPTCGVTGGAPTW
ncbi:MULTISPECIES: ALQxL family class IV lanthipeptide [Streptosporangium]|uniref:Uncharacterized protein n=1 Tax=Streptosporangium brasiliense TaxID=47480 RepID=A0ABT9R7B9_9ACTN|nr:ALQxL family class IV lanthipeptide [Streptosporangium brasiliense]MDP9865139.1 hypothetical protein [Streptosporangium brasiliense]